MGQMMAYATGSPAPKRQPRDTKALSPLVGNNRCTIIIWTFCSASFLLLVPLVRRIRCSSPSVLSPSWMRGSRESRLVFLPHIDRAVSVARQVRNVASGPQKGWLARLLRRSTFFVGPPEQRHLLLSPPPGAGAMAPSSRSRNLGQIIEYIPGMSAHDGSSATFGSAT